MKAELLHEILQMRGNTQISLVEILFLFCHSVLLGTFLTIQSFMFAREVDQLGKEKAGNLASYVLGASNILFLCVGLTGIMILVDNNLTRALSIGATLALTRFRVKLGQKNLGANLLFGIIIGVACGVGELKVAWLVTGIYLFLENVMLFLLKKAQEKNQDELILSANKDLES